MKTCIVLCSGGLDSVTTAFLAKKLHNSPTLLFFNYSQHSLKQERQSVKYFAKKLQAKFLEIKISKLIPKSPLNSKIKVSISRNLKNTSEESKAWYVPQRNLIFLSIASSLAESMHRKVDLFVGFKSEGSEPYPDTTEEFVSNFNRLIQKSTSKKVSLKSPLIKKDKEEIIQLAIKLGIELDKTFSCYSPKSNLHCGNCLACRLRKSGFYWANINDKTIYSN